MHGETGTLVPAGGDGDLAVAIAGLLRDPQLARAMGIARAQTPPQQEFSATRMAERFAALYGAMLGHPLSADEGSRAYGH